MNKPDFKKYGVLGCFKFKAKPKCFSYINYPNNLGELENTDIRNRIHNSLFELYNNIITQTVEKTIDTKQKVIATYINTIKVHPLTDFTLDAKYTSLEAATKLVLEENTKIILPTIKTKDLIKELVKRIYIKKDNK